MKIVYGVSGEGLGHVFEAIEIIGVLQRDGHTVKVLTYGDRACRCLAEFQPTRIEGVHLCFGTQGLSVWKTVRMNLRCLPFYLRNGPRLIRELAAFQPDAFLTAYEPFTTFASHWLHKPLISMDNQNELRTLARPPGAGAFAFHLARLTTRIVTCGADDYIVKSFSRRAGATGARIHVVAPIIQREIRRLEPTDAGPVLVYLTKDNPGLLEVLKTMDESFVVYCNNRVGRNGNLTFRAQGPDYLRDLAGCKAIIGTTGFSLIADSVYLRKPYYGVPLKKQFEQTHNAHFLAESGLGEFSEDVSRESLTRFLGRLPYYRQKLAEYALDPAQQEETLRGILARLEGRPVPDPRDGVAAACPGA